MIGAMLLVSLVVSAPVAKPAKLPPELGEVAWQRNYDAALAKARADNRPVMILFDEVPG